MMKPVMRPLKFQVPYGKSSMDFVLPEGMQADLALPRPHQPEKDVPEAIRTALAHPIQSAPLQALARRGQRVCIAFTDVTRLSPDHLLVGALLAELEKAGVHDRDITLLCSTGMHRPSTQAEKITKLGAYVVKRYRVFDNEPQNPAALVDLGVTPSGAPILLNRLAVEADLLIATGIVEPHQYAGYSGGSKTVAIGAAGEALIAHTHGPAFVDHPLTRLGHIDGNPFQQVVAQVAERAGLRFILNVVLDGDGRVLRVAAGHPQAAFRQLVSFARSVYEVPIPHQYDIAIGGVGFPKDSNLYQASRAPSYLFFAPTPVVRLGGFFIIPARCEEGAGAGVGEQRFLAAMRDAPSLQFLLDDARQNGYPPGQQRAFVMAKVLEQTRVVIVGSEYPQMVAECKMVPAATMEQALSLASQELGASCRVLVVPHAITTLPVVQQ
jgi:nickel-dependent lactate racemase